MPAQTRPGGLMAKYGAKLDAAVKKHAGDATDYGDQGLPGGIRDGVARLTKAEFGVYKPGTKYAGEYYFIASGVVVEPKSVVVEGREVQVAGRQTRLMPMPVCDTQGKDGVVTTEENVAKILNEMRKLGADTDGCGGAELEPLAETLTEAGPYFRFSTRLSPAVLNPDGTEKYSAKVWEIWYGGKGLEEYIPPDDEAVQDDSPPAPAPKAVSTKHAPPKPVAGKKPAPSPEPEPEPDEQQADDEAGEQGASEDVSYSDMTLDQLVEAADGADEDASDAARVELSNRAAEAGKSDEADAAGSWAEVKDIIEAAKAEKAKAGKDKAVKSPAKAAEQEPPATVSVGDVYHYTLVDPKTKKPFLDPKTKKPRKPVEVETIEVFPKKGVATVKELDSEKVHRDVPFVNLKPPF